MLKNTHVTKKPKLKPSMLVEPIDVLGDKDVDELVVGAK